MLAVIIATVMLYLSSAITALFYTHTAGTDRNSISAVFEAKISPKRKKLFEAFQQNHCMMRLQRKSVKPPPLETSLVLGDVSNAKFRRRYGGSSCCCWY